MEPVRLTTGVVELDAERAVLAVAVGYGLFDVGPVEIGHSGSVEIELLSPLDARRYIIRRALDVAEHWQVYDDETGWLAAAGPIDVQRWIHTSLDIPEERTLPQLFRDLVCFSIPVTLAWLDEDPGLRERRFGRLFLTDRWKGTAHWLDSLSEAGQSIATNTELDIRELNGRDAFFDAARDRYERAQGSLLQADADQGRVRRALVEAEARLARLCSLQAELAELQREVQNRRLGVAGLDAEIQRWQHWLSTRDRALKSATDHEVDWKAYDEATAEIARLTPQLTGFDIVRADHQQAAADVLALDRERVLVQEQLTRVREAEEAAVNLSEPVHTQQQLEQELTAVQERSQRLELASRGLQVALADSKRIELLLAEVERQLAEFEQTGSPASHVKKLEQELEQHQNQLREAIREVDHAHFLESAIRTVSSYLDDLRKGVSATERLTVSAGAGNGATHGQERTVAAHLREAVDNQVLALERQLRDWQTQSRDLAAVPQRVNQLRAALHQLQQELVAARKLEVRMGAVAALRQHRKNLRERLDQLNKLSNAYLKEQQLHADASTRASELRQQISALLDPRSEQLALQRFARRKVALEQEARRVERQLQERRQRLAQLESQMASLAELETQLAEQQRRRDDAHAGYCAYVAQQAIVELSQPASAELDRTLAAAAEQRRLLEQSETRITSLLSSLSEVEQAPAEVASAQAQLAAADRSAAEWKPLYESAQETLASAEETRQRRREREAQLAAHHRAGELLRRVSTLIQAGERAHGTQLRSDVAAAASEYLRQLMADSQVAVQWGYGETPALIKAGVSRALVHLEPMDQTFLAIALRLALAAEASRFGTVFISGLPARRDDARLAERLPALSGFNQFLVASG